MIRAELLKRVAETERALLNAIAEQRLARITVEEAVENYREAVGKLVRKDDDSALPSVSGAAA